eukprot:CAMPEP_0118924274 /NCGR_PEP_ID=MMETSP1169-20130426/2484_1 /TAXON_ID=36882 /ORGANISM="Pyramimonas obovata, Strain CCMP722" /LENGTH=70 /DNA_ID=CAMNT_0006865371 /DNA_START=156 /DNA_END=368 /DNA_ORIENTATION=-
MPLSMFMRYEAGVALAAGIAMASLFLETETTAAPSAVSIPLKNGSFLTTHLRERPSRVFDKAVDYYNVEA